MTEKDQVVLAYALASAHSALDHMHALRKVGRYVPLTLTYSIRAELFYCAREWLAIEDEHVLPDTEKAVTEARAYLAEHQGVLDELLTEREKVETSGR